MNMSAGSRKRTVAPRDEGDPATFLDEYFRDRGISGRHDSEAAREVQMRAEQARERFKRMRTEAASSASVTAATNATNAATSAATGLDADTLTKEQKYNRRLANNRKSAAASRVYNEVLRKETDFTLKEVVQKAKTYQDTIATMNTRLSETQKENERMKKRIAKLEEQVTKSKGANGVSVKKEEETTNLPSSGNTNSNGNTSGNSVGPRPLPAASGGASSILSGSLSLSGTGSIGSVIPRMPPSSSSSTRTQGTVVHGAVGVPSLPRLPPLRPVGGDYPAIPSLFGASPSILRLSQNSQSQHSTPSNSQEENHNIPLPPHPGINKQLPPVPSHHNLISRIGTFGGSQEARFSYPASQDHPPVQPFRLSQDLNKGLHLGSQEPEQSHRMSQEIIGADVAPSQS